MQSPILMRRESAISGRDFDSQAGRFRVGIEETSEFLGRVSRFSILGLLSFQREHAYHHRLSLSTQVRDRRPKLPFYALISRNIVHLGSLFIRTFSGLVQACPQLSQMTAALPAAARSWITCSSASAARCWNRRPIHPKRTTGCDVCARSPRPKAFRQITHGMLVR